MRLEINYSKKTLQKHRNTWMTNNHVTKQKVHERIKEEINSGKTLKGAIAAGYKRAFSAVLDCNVTTGVIGILLMIFGTGSMLSFAYTLLIGILMNFGLSIISSKLMLQSLASYKCFGNPRLYGAKKEKEVE